MTRYWIVPDADLEPTLWVAESEEPALADHSHPRAVARRCDTPPELWALARLLAAPLPDPQMREAMLAYVRDELAIRRGGEGCVMLDRTNAAMVDAAAQRWEPAECTGGVLPDEVLTCGRPRPCPDHDRADVAVTVQCPGLGCGSTARRYRDRRTVCDETGWVYGPDDRPLRDLDPDLGGVARSAGWS